MSEHWRRLWWLVGGIVCLDWGAKLWLLSTLFCGTCTAASFVQMSAAPPVATERISLGGFHYGDCRGVTLAVMLFPEPCDWERKQALASRQQLSRGGMREPRGSIRFGRFAAASP